MKRLFFTCILMLSGFFVVSGQELQEVVYLKNGSIIRGVIIEQIPNQSLKIQTTDGNVFVFNYAEIDKITKEKKAIYNVSKEAVPEKHKKPDGYRYPGLAVMFSILMPGGGQYYNCQIAKGIVINTLYTGSIVAGVIAVSGISSNADLFEDDFAPVFFVAASAIEIWSIIDAPISAHMKNKRKGLSLNYDLGRNAFISLKPDFSIRNIGFDHAVPAVGVNISFKFN